MNSPLAYSIVEASEVARVGRTSLYQAINTGELRAVKRAKRTLILADDLRRWLEKAPRLGVCRLNANAALAWGGVTVQGSAGRQR